MTYVDPDPDLKFYEHFSFAKSQLSYFIFDFFKIYTYLMFICYDLSYLKSTINYIPNYVYGCI